MNAPDNVPTRRRWLVAIAVAAVCLGPSGCASSGKVRNPVVHSAATVGGYEAVVVETTSGVSDSETQRRLLHALIASGLQSGGRFRRVTGSGTPAAPGSALRVVARIVDLAKVSDGARVLVGALAGQAGVVVEVEVTAAETGARLKSFQAVGKSSGGWVGAGTTDQAIQRVAEQVVAEINALK